MKGIIERYRSRLPVTDKTPIVTLNEGSTPLVRADLIAASVGLTAGSVFLKCEGSNPTGSFKDRGMTVAISKALEAGAKGVICASTGNTAASAAAYAARAGLRCVIFVPKAGVALGKLAQAIMHGAQIVEVRGNFDKALSIALGRAKDLGYTVVNSVNPHRIEGQKTAAFEIVEELGSPPDFHFLPVGNAGNITAYWKGYCEFADKRPRMMGFQAAGAAPLVLGRPVKDPKTVASAIRIGNPACREGALRARDESDGAIESVTDAEILSAYRLLAKAEGVFCEPASAASVAGLLKCGRHKVPLFGKIVCTLTGHGLKDPQTPLGFKHRRLTYAAGAKRLPLARKP
ncbi:MAG: threonine synthase [Elusimicrobia bacterium]|nr:threonine synthase [Elusimicrobiota bacterium]